MNKHFLWLAIVAVSFALLAAPCRADVYYGGFEDLSGTPGTGSDYDYNDIAFQLSGVTLNANGAVWFTKPVLQGALYGQTPFWNNESFDGSNDNIGYCIYSSLSGACGSRTGVPLDPTALYLAANNTSPTGSANDVTFTPIAGVGGSLDVELTITSDADRIGWALISSPSSVTWLAGVVGTTYTISATTPFELVAENTTTNKTYYSDTTDGNGNETSGVSHFAFFGNPASVPEPASIILLGTAFALAASRLRRHRA